MGQMHPAFANMPRTRQQILWFLKRSGEAPAETVAESLGITVSGARQHLSGLEKEGLLSHRDVREGPGRPRHLYSLTPLADSLFPRNYDQFTNEVLELMQDEDPSMLPRIMERRARRRFDAIKARMQGLGLEDKVRELAGFLDEEGYLVDFQRREDGSFLLVEHNCAVLSVALHHGNVCTSELDLLQQLLPEATVRRMSHIVSGEHVCAYVVEPGPEPAEVGGDRRPESGVRRSERATGGRQA